MSAACVHSTPYVFCGMCTLVVHDFKCHLSFSVALSRDLLFDLCRDYASVAVNDLFLLCVFNIISPITIREHDNTICKMIDAMTRIQTQFPVYFNHGFHGICAIWLK